MAISIRHSHFPKVEEKQLVIVPVSGHLPAFLNRLRLGEVCSGNELITWKGFVERLADISLGSAIPAERIDLYATAHSAFLSQNELLPDLREFRFSAGVVKCLVNLFFIFDEAGLLEGEQIKSVVNCESDSYFDFAVRVYGHYRRLLREKNLLTSADLCNLAAKGAKKEGISAFGDIRKLVLHNFVEFTIPQRNLIDALSRIVEVEISLPMPYDYYHSRLGKSVIRMLENFGMDYKKEASESGFERLMDTKNIKLFAFPHSYGECRFIARKIVKEIKDSCGQMRLDDILVVSPSPELYRKLLAREFFLLGWSEEPSDIGYDICSLIENIRLVLKSNMGRVEIVNFCSNPTIFSSFGIDVSELRNELLRERIIGLKTVTEIHKGCNHIAKLIDLLGRLSFLEEEYSISRLPEIVERTGMALKPALDRYPTFAEQYDAFLDSARRFALFHSAGEFKEKGYELLRFLAQFTSIDRGGIDCPVKVLRFEEARGVYNAKLVIFSGLTRENFPSRHEVNPFLRIDDHGRFFISDRAGVDRVSFLTCIYNADKVYISFPLAEADGRDTGPPADVIEIAFRKNLSVERIEFETNEETQKILIEIPSRWELALASREFAQDFEKDLSSSHIRIRDIIFQDGAISASDIKSFAGCPRRFFLEKILGEPELPELERDVPMGKIGEVVHCALAEFYGKRIESQFGAIPSTIDEILITMSKFSLDSYEQIEKYRKLIAITEDNKEASASHLADILEEKLVDLYRKFGDIAPEHLREKYLTMLVRDLRNKSGPIWDFLIKEEIDMIPPGLPIGVEVRIETTSEPKIRGRVDRIDLVGDGKVRLIDYKTGRLPTRPAPDIQFPVYKLIIGDRIEIWDAKFFWSLANYSELGESKATVKEESEEKIREHIDRMWKEENAFFEKIKDCYNCPFCHWCKV